MGKLSLTSSKKTLLINTVMLYIMQFSTTLLGLIIIPIQTNRLDPDYYGTYIEAVVAIVAYFRLVIDFGFLQSATEKISRKREDKTEISRILTSVVTGKLFLIAISFGILYILTSVIPSWGGTKQTMLFLYFFAEAAASMTPDFLYRGLEKMSAITYRTVSIRVVFTVAIFLFFKGPENVWMIPGFTFIGNTVAMIIAYIHIKTKLGIGFGRFEFKHAVKEFGQSVQFFFSRIASTVYSTLNIILLDFITAGGAATGLYGLSNRLMTAGRNALMPISDSMYPYMAKHKDFKLVKKLLLIMEPVVFVGCSIVFIFAKPFCMLFGAEYADAANVLRAMLPLAIITLPNYILGFPTMTAMGKTKHANYSTIVGSVFHICLLGVLWLTGNMTADKALLSLAWSVSATEAVILGYRLIIIYKFRNLMRGVPAEEDVTE